MPRWLTEHEGVLWGLGIASAVMFVAGLVAVPLLVVHMPADYFLLDRPAARGRRRRHPALRFTLRAVKNLLGAVLLAAGLAMLVLPGQGVLTLLVALGLLDFPGKRKLELWLIRRPAVLRAVNWLRARKGRPPLKLPPADGA